MSAESDHAVVDGRRALQVELVEDVEQAPRVDQRRPAAAPRSRRRPLRSRLAEPRQVVQEDDRVGAFDLGPGARDADALDLVDARRAARRCRRRAAARPRSGSSARPCRASCPAIAVTIASSAPASALSSELLPTFGWPARTTRMPSRSKRALARARSTASTPAVQRAAAGPARRRCRRKSISSSGKSSVASTSMRSSISASRERVDLARERAVERARRRARRGLGAGVDQVGDGLGLGEVELVVEEGALGELAGLGDAQARQPLAPVARRARRPPRGSARAAAAARPARRAPAARARLRRCTSAAPGRRSPGPGRSALPAASRKGR